MSVTEPYRGAFDGLKADPIAKAPSDPPPEVVAGPKAEPITVQEPYRGAFGGLRADPIAAAGTTQQPSGFHKPQASTLIEDDDDELTPETFDRRRGHIDMTAADCLTYMDLSDMRHVHK